MRVEVLVSPVCGDSLKFAKVLRDLCREKGLEFREISVWSPEGERIVLKKGVRLLPAVLLDGEVISQGSTDLWFLEGDAGGKAAD